jgi:hypothetical protein
MPRRRQTGWPRPRRRPISSPSPRRSTASCRIWPCILRRPERRSVAKGSQEFALKVRFAPDSLVEGAGFEPSVPLYGGARCTRARATRPAPPSGSLGTPDCSRRRAICGTPRDRQRRVRDRLRRLRASGGVSVRLLGKVRDLLGRSDCRQGKGPNSGRERDSLIRVELSLIARFNSL